MKFASKEDEEQFKKLNKERQDLIVKSFLSGLSSEETTRLDGITKLLDEQRTARMAKDLERLEKLAEQAEGVAHDITDFIRQVREQVDEAADG